MKTPLSPARSRLPRLSRILTLAVPALLLAGCVEAPRSAVVYGPPPPPVETVVPAAPGPGYVWIRGHYGRGHRGYFWIGGHWAYAPRPGMVWMEGHWENRGGAYVYVDGYWR